LTGRARRRNGLAFMARRRRSLAALPSPPLPRASCGKPSLAFERPQQPHPAFMPRTASASGSTCAARTTWIANSGRAACGMTPARRACWACRCLRNTAGLRRRLSPRGGADASSWAGRASTISASRCTTPSSPPTSGTTAPKSRSARWLPRLCTGELVGAIAMTEPGAGSDLQGVKTTARQVGQPVRPQRLQDLHHQRPDWPT
jgi:hypothetical protein